MLTRSGSPLSAWLRFPFCSKLNPSFCFLRGPHVVGHSSNVNWLLKVPPRYIFTKFAFRSRYSGWAEFPIVKEKNQKDPWTRHWNSYQIEQCVEENRSNSSDTSRGCRNYRTLLLTSDKYIFAGFGTIFIETLRRHLIPINNRPYDWGHWTLPKS